MTRRTFAGLLPAVVSKATAPKRNILFIAIDDLNDWVGCLKGHPHTITPNLDRLAGQGVNFTSAHCAAPLCNPARAALLTGRRPSSTGVYLNTQPYHGARALEGAVTLNQQFKNSGYLTLGCGKIYHGTMGAFADHKGWDDYGRTADTFTLNGTPPLAGAAGQAHFDWGPINGDDPALHDYQTTEWISRHLEKRHSQPLFLACGFTRPHLPWYVPKKYFDMHPLDAAALPRVKDDDLDDVPAIGRRFALASGDHARVTRAGVWREGVQAYLASITFADAMVGRVLRALESGPNAATTDVILWSDHGWHLGEKLHWRKFTLWERSTRNVLMMRAAGVTRPGGACHRPVSMMDIYPTLMELAGLSAPQQLEGESLMRWLKRPDAPKTTPALTTYQRGNHAVRSERWRYIRYKDGTEELYDRSQDPDEWTNLAARPGMEKVKAELAAHLPKHDEPDAPVRREGEAD